MSKFRKKKDETENSKRALNPTLWGEKKLNKRTNLGPGRFIIAVLTLILSLFAQSPLKVNHTASFWVVLEKACGCPFFTSIRCTVNLSSPCVLQSAYNKNLCILPAVNVSPFEAETVSIGGQVVVWYTDRYTWWEYSAVRVLYKHIKSKNFVLIWFD